MDGIATMQFRTSTPLSIPSGMKSLNGIAPANDPHLKVLQAAHISDDEYFSQMVRDDLNLGYPGYSRSAGQ